MESVQHEIINCKEESTDTASEQRNDSECHTSHANSILKGLNQQRQNGQYTDVILSCRGELFPCHKAVLAASSQYFQDKFDYLEISEPCTEVVTVDDIKIESIGDSPKLEIDYIQPVALKKIIDFIYTSDLQVDIETACDLLEAGRILQFPNVLTSCCSALQESLCALNCLHISQLAKKHNCSALYQKAWTFALNNFNDVVLQETFNNISFEQLTEYIKDENLQVKNEDEVFQAVMSWIKSDADQRLLHLPQVLQHVRLPLLSNNLIQNTLLNDMIFNASPECIDQLKDAENLKDLANKNKQLNFAKFKPRSSTFTEVLAIVGGMQTDRSWSRDISYYNPSGAKWNHLTELPFLTTDYSISALGTSIYVIGGYKKELEIPSSEVWRYDTEEEKWRLVSDINVPRFNHTSTTLDGRLYVIGGENDLVGLTEVEMYDPVTDSWEILGKTNEMESNITAVGLNNKLYITGWLVHPRQTCVTQYFDLKTKECIVLPNCSGLNRQIFPTVLLNDSIYLLGASRIKEVSMYDPNTYKIKKVESMRYKRNSPSAAVVGGMIYVTGGELRHHLDKVEVYNPDEDTWTALQTMPLGLCFHGCIGVKKYLGPPFFEPLSSGQCQDVVTSGAGDACEPEN